MSFVMKHPVLAPGDNVKLVISHRPLKVERGVVTVVFREQGGEGDLAHIALGPW